MTIKSYEIDCTQQGAIGYNTTDQSIDSLKPYLYRIDIEGENKNASIGIDDPAEASFKVVEMNDIRMEIDEIDEDQITIFFKAKIEFDLDFILDWDYEDECSGKFFEALLEETGWSVMISSNTIGLETTDGERDNFGFDGTRKGINVPLKKL